VNNYDTIVLEGLKVQNMLKNRKLSKAISDCGFGLFREMLDKKCKIYGKELIVADTFFPSSKTCSSCGVKKIDLKLSDRTFRCGGCGFEGCRDWNAATNLEKYGLAARN
jgi:putative transposase